MVTEQNLIKGIFAIQKAIDEIDDGYHLKEIGNLIKVSNSLFYQLSNETQIKLQNYYDKKMAEA